MGRGQGATKEHSQERSVTEEQRRPRPVRAQPEGWQIFQARAALLVGRRSMRIFSLLAPCPSLKFLATHPFLFMRWVLVHCLCSDAIKSDAKASGDHHGSPNTGRSARGRIGVGSPRRSCRPHHQGRRGAIRHRPRIDRGCLLRRYQPGRRGQPQRRAHGRAAGGPPRVRAGFDGESPLCVGAGSRQHRGAHDRGESRRCVHRRRRRVDEPCTLCAQQGGVRVRPVAADLR